MSKGVEEQSLRDISEQFLSAIEEQSLRDISEHLTKHLQIFMKEAGKEITSQEAENLLSRVGQRLIMKQLKEEGNND